MLARNFSRPSKTAAAAAAAGLFNNLFSSPVEIREHRAFRTTMLAGRLVWSHLLIDVFHPLAFHSYQAFPLLKLQPLPLSCPGF